MTLLERFESKYTPEPYSGCWLWTAMVTGRPYQYGYMTLGGRFDGRDYAHRISYRLFRGTIPEGKHVCHECDTPLCVNPDHLFLGTPLTNAQDRDKKGRGRKW